MAGDDPSGAPSDLLAKLRKRKSPTPESHKVSRKKQKHQHQHQFMFGHGGGCGATGVAATGGGDEQHCGGADGDCYIEDDDDATDALPMVVSTVLDPAHEGIEAWSLVTKGFFQTKGGGTFRAGYTVIHRGLCIARAISWNDEFDEVRFQHQGPCSAMASLVPRSITQVAIGLMAIVDALTYARSFPYCWQVFVDNNIEVLRLVDMYQRNWKFLKYHPERALLHHIMECAKQQAGRIHLRRK